MDNYSRENIEKAFRKHCPEAKVSSEMDFYGHEVVTVSLPKSEIWLRSGEMFPESFKSQLRNMENEENRLKLGYDLTVSYGAYGSYPDMKFMNDSVEAQNVMWKAAEEFEGLKDITEPTVKDDRSRAVVRKLNDDYRKDAGHSRYIAVAFMNPEVGEERTNFTDVNMELCNYYGFNHRNEHFDFEKAAENLRSRDNEAKALAEEAYAAYVYAQAEAAVTQAVLEQSADEIIAPEVEKTREKEAFDEAMDALEAGRDLASLENVEKAYCELADVTPNGFYDGIQNHALNAEGMLWEAGRETYDDTRMGLYETVSDPAEVTAYAEKNAAYDAKHYFNDLGAYIAKERYKKIEDTFGRDRAKQLADCKGVVITSKGDVKTYGNAETAKAAMIIGCREGSLRGAVKDAMTGGGKQRIRLKEADGLER